MKSSDILLFAQHKTRGYLSGLLDKAEQSTCNDDACAYLNRIIGALEICTYCHFSEDMIYTYCDKAYHVMRKLRGGEEHG